MTGTQPPIAAQLRGLGLFVDTPVTAEATPVMASPSWWGADSECHVVRPAGDTSQAPTVYVKSMAGHAGAYTDIPQAFAAATEAGTLGVGPLVYGANAGAGVLAMESLAGRASTATLDVFDGEDGQDRLHQLAGLRRQVNTFTSITRVATVFDDIRALTALATTRSVLLPTDLDWMMRLVDMAEKKITATGFDLAPCHGDGNVSNVLLVDDGRMLLVDWDVAAMMDPLQDLGALLAEARNVHPDTFAAHIGTTYSV